MRGNGDADGGIRSMANHKFKSLTSLETMKNVDVCLLSVIGSRRTLWWGHFHRDDS
jgi:hypothetical protein